MIDVDKLNFHSSFPIDKIVLTGTTIVANDGATTGPQIAKIVTGTEINTYNKAVFARAVWSIDAVNYNSLSSHLLYTFSYTIPGPATSTLSGLKAGCSVGVNASTIYFRTANGYHGNVVDNGITIAYTPNPLIFTIKWALMEIS